MAVLFHHRHSRVAELIRQHEQETGEIVPRRGMVHDMGRMITHKGSICCKAYLEAKPTHVIACETYHSPEAVDHHILGFARVHFATVQRGIMIDQTVFAIQRPRSLVEEYVKMIHKFGLEARQVSDRTRLQLEMCEGRIVPSFSVEPEPPEATQSERREQAQPLPVDPLPSQLG